MNAKNRPSARSSLVRWFLIGTMLLGGCVGAPEEDDTELLEGSEALIESSGSVSFHLGPNSVRHVPLSGRVYVNFWRARCRENDRAPWFYIVRGDGSYAAVQLLNNRSSWDPGYVWTEWYGGANYYYSILANRSSTSGTDCTVEWYVF